MRGKPCGWTMVQLSENTLHLLSKRRPLISLSANGRKSRSSGKRLWLFYLADTGCPIVQL